MPKKKKTSYPKCKTKGCEKRATQAGYCRYHFMNEPEMSNFAKQQTKGRIYKHPTKGLF